MLKICLSLKNIAKLTKLYFLFIPLMNLILLFFQLFLIKCTFFRNLYDKLFNYHVPEEKLVLVEIIKCNKIFIVVWKDKNVYDYYDEVMLEGYHVKSDKWLPLNDMTENCFCRTNESHNLYKNKTKVESMKSEKHKLFYTFRLKAGDIISN